MRDLNYVIVASEKRRIVELAIKEFADLYKMGGILFLSSIKNDRLFLIRFTNEFDFDTFKYFVNHLTYSSESRKNIDVRGYWTIAENYDISRALQGKRIMLFVPEDDEETDNVFGVTDDNQTIKFGFAVGEEFIPQNKIIKNFEEPKLEIENFEILKKINYIKKNTKKNKSFQGVIKFFEVYFLSLILILAGIGAISIPFIFRIVQNPIDETQKISGHLTSYNVEYRSNIADVILILKEYNNEFYHTPLSVEEANSFFSGKAVNSVLIEFYIHNEDQNLLNQGKPIKTYGLTIDGEVYLLLQDEIHQEVGMTFIVIPLMGVGIIFIGIIQYFKGKKDFETWKMYLNE